MNFSYYGVSLDLSGLGLNVYLTQLVFGAVELPSKLLVYLSVRHAGRRLTMAGTLLGAALAVGLRILVSPPIPVGPAPSHPGSPDSRPVKSRPLPRLHLLSWENLGYPARPAHCLNPFPSRDEVLEHCPGGDGESFF